jgi:enamine deaminase RidA (YjgF/YER057c/UK114 family)
MPKKIVPVPGLIDSSDFGFSHCVTSGDLVFVSGECGHGADGAIPEDFREQARLALDAVRLAVEAAGGTLDDVVSMTVFITHREYYPVFSEVRKEFFPDRFPTSAAVGVSFLVPPGAMIEIQATAIVSQS